MRSGLNSHYFHIIGDKLINPIVGDYIPIIRIPIKRWEVSHPQKNATTLTMAHMILRRAMKFVESDGWKVPLSPPVVSNYVISQRAKWGVTKGKIPHGFVHHINDD